MIRMNLPKLLILVSLGALAAHASDCEPEDQEEVNRLAVDEIVRLNKAYEAWYAKQTTLTPAEVKLDEELQDLGKNDRENLSAHLEKYRAWRVSHLTAALPSWGELGRSDMSSNKLNENKPLAFDPKQLIEFTIQPNQDSVPVQTPEKTSEQLAKDTMLARNTVLNQAQKKREELRKKEDVVWLMDDSRNSGFDHSKIKTLREDFENAGTVRAVDGCWREIRQFRENCERASTPRKKESADVDCRRRELNGECDVVWLKGTKFPGEAKKKGKASSGSTSSRVRNVL